MVTEHIAREPGSTTAQEPRQRTIDGGTEPVVTSDAAHDRAAPEPAKKARRPKRSDAERIADANAEIERVKGKAKQKVADGMLALRKHVDILIGDAERAEMARLVTDLKGVAATLQKLDTIPTK